MSKKKSTAPQHVDLLDLLSSDELRDAALGFPQLDDALTFLRALAEGQTISDAARTAGGTMFYGWRKKHAWFDEMWAICEDIGADFLEDVAQKRATTGWEEPVFYKGVEAGTVTKYSDMLLMRLLEGRKPERYKVRHEHGGKSGAPIIFQVAGDDTKLG